MKRILTVSALLATVLGFGALGVGVANAAPNTCTGSETSVIYDDPDSGGHGNWAVDTMFDRVTTAKADCTGVLVTDTGSFTTISGADSPHQGLALPAKPVTGTFTGRITLSFTAKHAPGPLNLSVLPKVVHNPKSSVTGQWASLLGATENNDWIWTYTTGCEKWIDAVTTDDGQSKNAGDITGKTCKPKGGGTTTTAPPTTTTTAPPTSATTSLPPTSVAGSGGSSGGSAGTVSQVSILPVGAPQTGFGGAYVSNDEWLLYGALALLLLGAAGAVAFFVRRGTRVTS